MSNGKLKVANVSMRSYNVMTERVLNGLNSCKTPSLSLFIIGPKISSSYRNQWKKLKQIALVTQIRDTKSTHNTRAQPDLHSDGRRRRTWNGHNKLCYSWAIEIVDETFAWGKTWTIFLHSVFPISLKLCVNWMTAAAANYFLSCS